jgi:hypothetical protein
MKPTRVEEIAASKEPRAKKLAMLMDLYEQARAEQRAATESAMIENDGLADTLRRIELALETLGADPVEQEGKSASTL